MNLRELYIVSIAKAFMVGPVNLISRRFLRRQDGAAAIEFAIIGGLFCMMLVVGGDLGLAYYSNMQVQTSAQVGAQYAVMHGFKPTAISQAVVGATSVTGIGASPAPTQFCGCPSSATLSTASCTSTCADGTTAGTYVKVTASRNYTTLISYPSVPASFALSATSTVRIK